MYLLVVLMTLKKQNNMLGDIKMKKNKKKLPKGATTVGMYEKAVRIAGNL